MLYREAGQFKTDYAADQAIFPIAQDRVFIGVILAAAFLLIPWVANDYWLETILIPFLIFSLAAIGLNLLTGYTGLLSLGTGAFMGVGAYACYKLTTYFPGVNIIVWIVASGFVAAAVGVVFGLPAVRIKGFYLAVATLAAQFFFDWLFLRVGWFTNYTPSGSVTAPQLNFFGWVANSDVEEYWLCLGFVCVVALLAKNLVRSRIGRSWMAIRDMDIAAEIIGIRPMHAKLSAFAVSSFYIGIAGAMWAFVYTSSVEALAFEIQRSFQVLFMIIIGGLGSVLGSFFGAAFIVLLPIFLNQAPALFGVHLSTAMVSHLEAMIFGALIILFLVVEPHGLARLWQIGKEKLRRWPFPY